MNLEGNDFTGKERTTVIIAETIAPSVFIEKTFVSHGHIYGIDNFSVIHQLDAKPYTYDAGYVATYDTPEYVRDNERLQQIRLDFIKAAHGSLPLSLLDVGYGNGAFLKAAKDIPIRYGKDVTGLQIPGVSLTNEYIPADVVTFWDCLEHIPDLSFLKDLAAQTLVISLPWCHFDVRGQEWFDNEYKHRKPDEHLHHFNAFSLMYFMKSMGWKYIDANNNEDEIRKSVDVWPNILSMAFKRG